MKLLRVFLMILCVGIFHSCKKSSSNNTSVNSMSATINGVSFVSTGTTVFRDFIFGTDLLNISGIASDGRRIDLSINSYKRFTGNFFIDTSFANASATYGTGVVGASTINGKTGKIIITSVVKNSSSTIDVVSGTFYFNNSGLSVSDGNFKVNVYY